LLVREPLRRVSVIRHDEIQFRKVQKCCDPFCSRDPRRETQYRASHGDDLESYGPVTITGISPTESTKSEMIYNRPYQVIWRYEF
jgi:hypothetical protein